MVKDMSRTIKLFKIFIILLVAFMGYLTYIKRDSVKTFVSTIISKFKEDQIIIPYDKTKNKLEYDFKTVHETDNFKPNNFEELKDIYYTVLNNGWEEFTFYCPKDYTECANDVRKIANGNEFITKLNNFVSPFNSYKKYNTYITNNSEIYLKIDKLYSETEISQINIEIDRIFKLIGINKNKDLLDNIKSIHDYLIQNIEYDEEYTDDKSLDTISNKANGALFNKKALCSGYTDTFALMLDRLNVPNFKISNDEHVWNVIYNNGKWSHIDVTWDDDEVNKDNYYNFYMINTDELLEKDKEQHQFNQDFYKELK